MIEEKFLNMLLNTISLKSKEIFGSKLIDVKLYGSYARNEYNKDSDIDIALLVSISENEYSFFRKIIAQLAGQLSLDYDITVSIKIFDSDFILSNMFAVPFYNNIINQGISINVQ